MTLHLILALWAAAGAFILGRAVGMHTREREVAQLRRCARRLAKRLAVEIANGNYLRRRNAQLADERTIARMEREFE